MIQQWHKVRIERNLGRWRRRCMLLATTQPSSNKNIATTHEVKTSSIKKWGGGYLNIKYDTWKARYAAEYTGEILRRDLVQTAMVDELDDFHQHVWEIDALDHMNTVPDYMLVRSRWGHGEQGRLQGARRLREAGRL